jgi:hypothetical protein
MLGVIALGSTVIALLWKKITLKFSHMIMRGILKLLQTTYLCFHSYITYHNCFLKICAIIRQS